MNVSDLQVLGLSEAESVLYLALLRLGPSTAAQLVRETQMYKANVYQSLQRLYQKGIISQHTEKNHKLFRIQRPDSLLDYVAKKQEELKEQTILAEKLIEEVRKSKSLEKSPETAEVYYGIAGVKKLYKDVLEKGYDLYVFGSTIESEKLIGEHYWHNLHLKRVELGIHFHMIFHKSLRHWSKLLPKEYTTLRFFEEEFEPITETNIYGDCVAFTVWEETPIVTIIENKHVAASMKQTFDLLWKQAKE